jgi:hypothetical protein
MLWFKRKKAIAWKDNFIREPELQDFGVFGQWDIETLLAQCKIRKQVAYPSPCEDDFDFIAYAGCHIEILCTLPDYIKQKHCELEECADAQRKKAIKNLTLEQLENLLAERSKTLDYLQDYQKLKEAVCEAFNKKYQGY